MCTPPRFRVSIPLTGVVARVKWAALYVVYIVEEARVRVGDGPRLLIVTNQCGVVFVGP